MYPEYARNTHSEYIVGEREPDFTIDAQKAATQIKAADPTVVLIASPNNPTGTATSLDVIAHLAGEFPEVVLVVDEAYQEFSTQPTALTLLPDFANLAVARTMSKAFAFAGGRLGYLAASPEIVDACRIVRLPYHLSTQTQVCAQVALRFAGELLAQVGELRQTRDEMLLQLPQLGVEVVPSEANFVLFGRFQDRHDVWRKLLEKGVLTREVGPEGYLRVSAGTPAETRAFYEALAAVMERGSHAQS
jgi:histidinol-phosphate aminotransferase